MPAKPKSQPNPKASQTAVSPREQIAKLSQQLKAEEQARKALESRLTRLEATMTRLGTKKPLDEVPAHRHNTERHTHPEHAGKAEVAALSRQVARHERDFDKLEEIDKQLFRTSFKRQSEPN